MAEQEGISGTDVTPEQFVQLVSAATDDEIAQTIRAAGTESVLDRIFDGMQERFLPERAQGVDATIQFAVTDDGTPHHYALEIANGSCAVEKGTADQPRVTLTTDIVSFARLVAGQAQGPQLFMTGKLKVSGDLMFSARIMTFFDQPKAS